ncbi:hypothetical protein [Microbacterium sp. 22242]|uniref:hypothetical protein n=1 Tax=Microbacterium sp. 22242 TaxID=3453896 RepID=UPI003F879FE4
MTLSKGSAGALSYVASAAGALTLAAAGILIAVPAAYAADSTTCTPAAAYDEQVLVTPAVPATPGTPAVTQTVPDQRWSWNPHGDQAGPGGSTPLNDPDHWTANTEQYKDGEPLGVAYQAGTPGNGDWFYWTTKEVVVTPAVPGTPGTPAVYKTVHHDAVTCPATVVTPPVVTPPVVTPPAPAPVAEQPTEHTMPATVQTDGDTTWIPIAAGGLGALAAASLAGAGLLMRGRRS